MMIVVCPYCKKGRVRAPVTAVGASATCPNCYNCFTVVENKEAPGPARQPQPAPVAAPAAPRPAASTQVSAAPILAQRQPEPIPDEEPVAPAPEPEKNRLGPIVAPLPAPPDEDEEARSTFGVSMVSLILAGIALAASQFPYGRFVTVTLSVLGLGVGLLALAGAYRGRRWPLAGLGLNAAALVLATLLPNWLLMKPWVPEKLIDDSNVTKAMPYNGGPGAAVAGGWVDPSKDSWQLGDARVTLTSAWVGQVELVGPQDVRANSKARYLVLGLRLTNVGVTRRLDYKGWNEPPPPKGDPVRVTDANGKVFAPAKFEPGWVVAERGRKTALFPGKSADDQLIFETPVAETDWLQVELPAWAITPDGASPGEPIRFQIPRSMIQVR